MFWIFAVHGKNGLRWLQMGPGGFLFLLIQASPTFGAERQNGFDFENFDFSPMSRFPDLQISGFPGFPKSGFPGFKNSTRLKPKNRLKQYHFLAP